MHMHCSRHDAARFFQGWLAMSLHRRFTCPADHVQTLDRASEKPLRLICHFQAERLKASHVLWNRENLSIISITRANISFSTAD